MLVLIILCNYVMTLISLVDSNSIICLHLCVNNWVFEENVILLLPHRIK